MSDYAVGSRKNDFQNPPRAFAANGSFGQAAVLAVSAVAIAVDLTKGISQAAYNKTVDGTDPTQVVRNYMTLQPDVDCGIIFGATIAAVSGTNAPVLATNGTLTGNTYTGAAGTCYVLKANTTYRFLLQQGLDNAMGIVATGAGKIRFYQSSPDNA